MFFYYHFKNTPFTKQEDLSGNRNWLQSIKKWEEKKLSGNELNTVGAIYLWRSVYMQILLVLSIGYEHNANFKCLESMKCIPFSIFHSVRCCFTWNIFRKTPWISEKSINSEKIHKIGNLFLFFENINILIWTSYNHINTCHNEHTSRSIGAVIYLSRAIQAHYLIGLNKSNWIAIDR